MTTAGTGSPVVALGRVLEAISDGAMLIDHRGHRTYTNRILNWMVGGDARAPIDSGEPPTWLPPDLHDRYRRYVRDAGNGRFAAPTLSLEWALIDADHRRREVAMRLLTLSNGDPGSHATLWFITPKEPAAVAVRLEEERREKIETSIRHLLEDFSDLGLPLPDIAALDRPGSPSVLDVLSDREQEVVHCLLQGHRVATIADMLCISEHTVRNHLKAVFRKLEVHSQREVVELVRQSDRR